MMDMEAETDVRLWITFDIEEDHHCNYPSLGGRIPTASGSIARSLDVITDLLACHGAQATLFLVGEIVEKYRSILSRMQRAGHEIACHGLSHRFVSQMTPQEFRDDTYAAKMRIEDALGVRLDGYRAPSWSVGKNMHWFYEILVELGFCYSSSVFPIKNYLYGIAGAPTQPFRPLDLGAKPLDVIEIPAPVAEIGNFRIPYCGGFYLRAMPGIMGRILHSSFARRYGASMLYLHPGELGVGRSFEPPGLIDRLIHSYGTRGTLGKVEKLLAQAQSVSAADYVRMISPDLVDQKSRGPFTRFFAKPRVPGIADPGGGESA